jgi:hypothetical protein
MTLPAAPTATGQASTKAYTDEGLRTVSSLASITSPVTGQLALLTTDSMIYRYTGSAWLGILHTAPGAGFARYHRLTTGQSIPTSAPTRLAFNTVVNSHADITANGAVDTFTLNRTGTWHLEANAAIPSVATGTGFTLWIGNQNETARYELVNQRPNTVWITSQHVACDFRFTAGDQVAFYVYHDVGSSVTLDLSQMATTCSLKWGGP